MTRRWLAMGALGCWLASTSGLMFALHAAHYHEGHDQGACLVCHVLHYGKATTPRETTTTSHETVRWQDEIPPMNDRFTSPDPASPIVSRAPPVT